MRRLAIVSVCMAACVAAGVAGARRRRRRVAGAATRDAKPKPKPPARMLVYAQEWTMYGSRTSVPAGRVIVQLWNRGQDAHDMRIRRLGAHGQMVGRAQAVRTTQSGAISDATWKLGKGRYELYCSLFLHLQRGMHTHLTVR